MTIEEGQDWEDTQGKESATSLRTKLDSESAASILEGRVPGFGTSPAASAPAAAPSIIAPVLPAAGASADEPPPAAVPPPADARGSAGDPATARYMAIVRVAQEKEAAKERRALERQEGRDQAKRDKEAAKDLPETKAAKWVQGVAKDIASCKEAIAETKDNKLPLSKAKKFAMQKLFEEELKNLTKLQRNLDSTDKTKLTECLADAPQVVKYFQDQLRIWKKAKKASGAE